MLLLPACTSSSPQSSGEKSLRAAVERFWDLRIQRDYGTMYDQTLSRDAQAQYGSREDFIRTKGNVRYHWFEIEEIQVEGDSGSATVKYAWNHNVPTAARPEMKEIANREPSIDSATDEWILEDGEWRRKRVSINPFRSS